MADLDHTHHFFRHVKKTWMDGDFIDPAAFRLRTQENGHLEEGLSINWVEYFGKSTPQKAVGPLRNILIKKGRTIGGESKFVLLNVGAAKAAAAKFTPVAIITDEEIDDPSHAMVTGYQPYNDQVAEELQKVIITSFPAKP